MKNLVKLLGFLKFSGSSQIKDILLRFKEGKVSAYVTSPDRVCAVKVENFDSGLNIGENISINKVSLFENLLKRFDSLKVEGEKLLFKKEGKTALLKMVSFVDSDVKEEKFNDWIKKVKEGDFIEIKVKGDKIKEILEEGRVIKANEITIDVGKKIFLVLEDGEGNYIKHELAENKSKKEYKVKFFTPFLDVLECIKEVNSKLYINRSAPLLIEVDDFPITYLIASRMEES